jgi:2-hydroxychromene-2-carboxylate isomerase
MPSPITFYFDFISPYGYFGSTQIGPLAARYGRTVDWKPILLGVTVMKVMGLKPLMETPLKSDYMRHDKPRMAKLLGVPFADHGISGVSSVNAARAFLWLKSQDSQLAVQFAQRMYRRLWVDRRDITAPEASAEEAEALGVPGDLLLQALATEEIKNTLKQEVQAAIDRGVFGTPWFIVDDEPLWGVDRLWMLEHWLRHQSWEPARD